MVEGCVIDCFDYCCGIDQGVFVQVYWCWFGVCFDVVQGQVELFLFECVEYYVDGFFFVFEDWFLFDVCFEIGVYWMFEIIVCFCVVDGVQCFVYVDIVGIVFGQGFFQGEFFGEYV